jgi:hypothetical protein
MLGAKKSALRIPSGAASRERLQTVSVRERDFQLMEALLHGVVPAAAQHADEGGAPGVAEDDPVRDEDFVAVDFDCPPSLGSVLGR